ncbi:hypothetical protein [Paenibacillus lautus]|uniref:hypothetical protein n=1 Tax=Paenibacillus lautus TaxID=1401 RepID=UPI0039878FB6
MLQCQEASKGTDCTIVGVSGKLHDVATLQDLLIYLLKGISFLSPNVRLLEVLEQRVSLFMMDSLFATITNANFDREVLWEESGKRSKSAVFRGSWTLVNAMFLTPSS